MTNIDLAQSCLLKASSRLKILDVLLAEADYSDVIREAQEVVELATKAMLRRAGIDPPKWHDVGSIIMDHLAHFPPVMHGELEATARISKALRKEREISFTAKSTSSPARSTPGSRPRQPSPMPGTSWSWPAG